MHTTAKYILLCLILTFTNALHAQILGTHTYTINEDGVSPKIFTLYKSSKGFLLAGTANGLYRFDGRQFNAYNFSDIISKKGVTAIAEDKDGKIWLGLQSGQIAFVENKLIKLLNAEEGHPAAAITSILQDASQTIFFATAGEGIYYYQNKRFYNINMDDGLSDNYVYDLLLSKSGLIACTDRGLNIINLEGGKKKITTYTSANGLPDNIVRCLYAKNSTICWIGMQDKGIGIYTPSINNIDSSSYVKGWKYGQVNSIIGNQQQLWAATEDNGIVMMQFADNNMNVLTGIEAVNTGFSKTHNLLNDYEGNTWFTSNNQLVKTTGGQLQNIIPLDLKSYRETHAILADRAGNIWVNENAGLRKYFVRNNKWESKKYALSLLNYKTDITSLFEDKFGIIWVGTMGKGVIIVDPLTGKSRNLTEDNLLVNASVLSVNGKDEQVWISGLEGAVLCKLTDANKDLNTTYSFINYSKVSGIGSNYIYTTMVDSKNRVWFATDGKGISVFDNGRFTNYNQNNGIKSLVIYSLCEDANGNIWFSTLEGGVYKFDGRNFTNLSVQQGLNDATITALSTDMKGNIIAISKKGIILQAA